MKASLKVNEISRAAKLCVNALDVKDAIRSNIAFVAENDRLQMMATNGSYSITIACPCDVKEEGTAIVDGKMAYSCIAKGTTDCTLTADYNSMTIKTIGRTKLPNIDHELPMIKNVNGKAVTFNGVTFREAVNKISYAIAEDQSRIVLTGAHLVTDGSKAVLTALDGFRLAQTSIPCDGDAIDAIIPARILTAICDAITDGDFTLYYNGGGISAVGGLFRINAVTLTGDYIDTARLIPEKYKTVVLVKTVDIKNCADSATVASGASNLVTLSIANDSVTVTSNTQDADFHGEISAVVNGEPLDISFNLKYLLQAFAHINTEECELRMNTSVSPVIIAPHTEGDELHLILPVRTFR